ncbi:hypothetical protein AX15_000514 [Amanita polypyramis BW_CC]|nr:hypothetical protein AX15_000514 [Amanita polypyramis BW_CC]
MTSLARLARWLRRDADAGQTPSSQSDFTFPAVFIGLAIGCLICFTNLSLGLQSGWISMMSIQSALIGYLISRTLPRPLTPQEIIVVQTTAVATGTMPLAAGFVGILPALRLLDEERDGAAPVNLTWLSTISWSCAVAYFGVFLSPPLRKQVIIEEQLSFPSGTATAQLISVLHKLPPPVTSIRQRRGYREIDPEDDTNAKPTAVPSLATPDDDAESDTYEREAVQNEGWYDLKSSFAVSGFVAIAAYFFPVIFAIPVFGSYLAGDWLWYFTPSLSYVGQGIIMGFPTTLSMNFGMLVGWGILSPLAKFSGWAPGPVGDMGNGSRGWILWISLGIMCADSLVSLLPVVAEYVGDLLGRRSHYDELSTNDHETETPDRLVPLSWVIPGLLASVIIGTILVWVVFGKEHIKPWATILGFVLGGLLSVIGVRALGETDLNPVSGLGKVSQLFFAWLQPGNIVANIIAGGVAEAGAQQAGDLMQDLKTGHLCHASPRAQFFSQIIGSSISILVTATAYMLYNRAYVIPGPSFPAPTAYVWLSLARLLRDGQLPNNCRSFMSVFALIFGMISAMKSYATSRRLRYAKWIPSGVAFAIGILNTPSFSIARLIGGIMEYVYRTRYAKGQNDIRLVVIASGFVLGEAVGGVATGSVEAVQALDVSLCIVHVASTSHPNAETAGRRSRLPQLICRGKPCNMYQPEVIHCRRLPGGYGTDIDWKCEADLPDSLRFGKVEVSCEGWSGPGDPYVMKGSCSLDYRLVEVPGTLRGNRPSGWTSQDVLSLAFTTIWVLIVFYIAYSFIHNYLTSRNQGRRPGVQPSSGPRPGGGGGGGSDSSQRNFFPGGYDDPPPPYTDDRKRNQSDGVWRPGFWTGAALGGLATHWFNRTPSQAQPPPATPYDWERERSYQIPFASRPLRRVTPVRSVRDDDDRSEGPSNLGSIRRSTGFGGTNVR